MMQKVVKLLDAAIKEEGLTYLSIWSRKRYLDLFEYGPKGIGQIKSAEIASLFSFPQTASPKDIEQALCAEFEIYERSGFFKRLWWYFSRPVELYKKVYALTYLRDLKANLLLVKKPLDRESIDINKAFSSFLSLLKPLADYLNSFLPSFDSLNTIIRGQSQSVNQKMLEVFMKLKIEMEADYTGHLLILMSQKNSNNQENNQHWPEVEQWIATLKESLALKAEDISLDLSYREEFKALEATLDSMHSVLSTVNNYTYNPQINAFPVPLNKASDNNLVSHSTYFQKIEHDCAVTINEPFDFKLKAKNDTYALTFQKGQWRLSYSDKALNKDVCIPVEQVENLINLCATEVLDTEAIKQCIFTYHATRVSANKKDNPSKRYLRALDASLEKQVSKQLGDYSLKVFAKQIEANKPKDPQLIIEELMRHSADLHQANEPYINAYLAMCSRLELQKNHYEKLADLIEAQSLVFQKAALLYRLENPNITSDALRAHLVTVLLPAQTPLEPVTVSQEYNALETIAKKQIQNQLDKEKTINLKWIKKITKISENKSKVFDFFQPSKSTFYKMIQQEFEDLIENRLQLPKPVLHARLKEKALEMMEHVLRTDNHNSYTFKLAFTEINERLQFGIERDKAREFSQSFNIRQQPSQKPSNNPIAVKIPMPEVDSQSDWNAWLLKVKHNPVAIDGSIKDLEILVKKPAGNWETDLLRYSILIQLAVGWIEAIKWNAIVVNKEHPEASQHVVGILRRTNIVFAKRYHSDQNHNIDDEAMKSFNSCRDEGIELIESAMNSVTRPLWIKTMYEKNPKLFWDNQLNEFKKHVAELKKNREKLFEEMELEQIKTNQRLEKSQQQIDELKGMIKNVREAQKISNFSGESKTFFATQRGDLGLFSEKNRVFKLLRFPVTTVSLKHQQLLLNNNWEITQEEACDFFAVIASEIKKIKQNPKYDELTEAHLRRECYAFHHKNNNNKKTIASLNKAFQEMNENAFQTDRTENYHLIRCVKDINNIENSTITGFCCVEGVILCRVYKLPAIYEMTISPDDSIHYAYATRDGYKTCSEAEFNQNMEDSPIVLNHEGKYYFASKISIQSMLKKEDVSEDNSPTAEDNLIFACY